MTDTDEGLRKFNRQLFGRDQRDPDEIDRARLANPEDKPPGNVVAGEGDNPDPGIHFTREDHLRQLVLELFHPARAATDPVTFHVNP